MSRPGPIYVVGAGRLGTALLLAWRRADVAVAGAWSRSPAGATRAAETLGSSVASGPELPSDLGPAQVVVLAVPDDAVPTVAADLAFKGAFPPNAVLLHCSGVLDATALAPAAPGVAACGSLHPLQTVADPESGADALSGAFAAVEGDDLAVEAATALAAAAGLRPVPLAPGGKALYHAAAVLACNDLVALIQLAAELLEQAGVEPERGPEMLLPLLRETLDNVARSDLPAALTGPVRRGDAGTVRRHLAALSAHTPAKEVYRLLGQVALDLAQRAEPPPDPEDTAAIRALLGDE